MPSAGRYDKVIYIKGGYIDQRPAKSKIFNLNPARKKSLIPKTRLGPEKKIFFKPKPDPNAKKKNFNLKPDPNPKNFYDKILPLKNAFNIRISIGYKDNFSQVFDINLIFFKT